MSEALPEIRVRRAFWRRPIGLCLLAGSIAAGSYAAWLQRARLAAQARAVVLPELKTVAATTARAARDFKTPWSGPAPEPEAGPAPENLAMPKSAGPHPRGRGRGKRGRQTEDRRQHLFVPVLQPAPPPPPEDESADPKYIFMFLGIALFFAVLAFVLLSHKEGSKNLQ